jgi:DNA repair protein RecO (recombination protein O)
LVVGGTTTGESDRIVRLLTPRGRLDAYAPGARRSKRRFSGALEPFQTIEAQLHRRGPGLVTMRAASVRRARLGLRSDLERITLASYVAELGRLVAPEGEDTEMFAEVEACWDALERVDASAGLRRRFELRTLAVLGYRPAVGSCVVCGRSEGPAFLELSAGGRTCAAHHGGGPQLTASGWAWMGEALAEASRAETARPDPGPIGPALDRFLVELLERRPKSLQMVVDLGL